MGCKRGIRIESSLQGKCESSVSLVLSICSNLHSSKPVHLPMCAKAIDGSLFSCSVTTISMSWRTLIHNPLEYRLNFYHQFDLMWSGRNPKKGMRYIAFHMESECSKTLRWESQTGSCTLTLSFLFLMVCRVQIRSLDLGWNLKCFPVLSRPRFDHVRRAWTEQDRHIDM